MAKKGRPPAPPEKVAEQQELYLSLLRLGKSEREIDAVQGMPSWPTRYLWLEDKDFSTRRLGVTAVLPLRISAHWEAGKNGRAVVGAAMFGILVAFAVAGSIGFGIQNRSQIAGSGETLAAQLKDEIADRDQAVTA